jgi:ATP-dependent DNA ligase
MQFQLLCEFIRTCRTAKGKGSIKLKELEAQKLGKLISEIRDVETVVDVLSTLYPQNHPEKFMPIGLTTLAYLLRHSISQTGRLAQGVARGENPLDWVNRDMCNGKGNVTVAMIQRGIRLLYKTTGESKCRNLICVLEECTPEEGRLFCEIVGCTLTFGFGVKHFFDSWKDESIVRSWIMTNSFKKVSNSIVTGTPCKLEPGYYISSMLARQKPFHDPLEALQFIELKKRKASLEVYAQLKIDGYRIQLHRKLNRFWYYSRHNLDMGDTYFFRELNNELSNQIVLDSYILDGEIIAYDKTTSDFIPCQEMSSFLWMSNPDIILMYFVFDILFYNGIDCTRLPYTKRLSLLREYVQPNTHVIPMVEGAQLNGISLCIKLSTSEQLTEYYNSVISNDLEGLILKDPHSTWEPYSRSNGHIKVKPAPQPFTLYIVGCNINRMQLVSSVLLAQKHNNGHYYTVGYAGTGLTNIARAKLTELVTESTTSSTKGGRDTPDWLHIYGAERPHMFIYTPYECHVSAHKLMKSKIYTGGYTLRFPVIQQIPVISYDKCKPILNFEEGVPIEVGFIREESTVLNGLLILIVKCYDSSLVSEIQRNILRMGGGFTCDLSEQIDLVIVPDSKIDEVEYNLIKNKCTIPMVTVDWLRKTYLWNEKMPTSDYKYLN